jgi:hypothetical protein
MPNHYDTDVYCHSCGKYLFSFLHESEDSGKRFCNKACEKVADKNIKDKRKDKTK